MFNLQQIEKATEILGPNFRIDDKMIIFEILDNCKKRILYQIREKEEEILKLGD
jgi:hypothetical protein